MKRNTERSVMRCYHDNKQRSSRISDATFDKPRHWLHHISLDYKRQQTPRDNDTHMGRKVYAKAHLNNYQFSSALQLNNNLTSSLNERKRIKLKRPKTVDIGQIQLAREKAKVEMLRENVLLKKNPLFEISICFSKVDGVHVIPVKDDVMSKLRQNWNKYDYSKYKPCKAF